MRIERFYALLGLFVGGALILTLFSSIFLYENHQHKDSYVLFFNGSLNGLDTSSTITYRGVKIGQVKLIELAEVGLTKEIRLPVYVEFYIERSFIGHHDPIKILIDEGYVARIKKPNLLTGIASIDLVKSKSPHSLTKTDYQGHPIFPTQNRIEQYETLDNTLKIAQKTLEAIRDFILSKNVTETVESTKKMAANIAVLAHNLDQKAPTLMNTLTQALSNISNAANSMQNLTDYLSRNPEALLRGKK